MLLRAAALLAIVVLTIPLTSFAQLNTPYPTLLGTDISLNATLTWTIIDPEPGSLTYDVHFGTDASPPLVASGLTQTSYQLPPLTYSTEYHWQITVHGNSGETTGDVWAFTTRPANYAPSAPTVPSPVNNALFVKPPVMLSWRSSDIDGNPLTYDVYLGTSSPPTLVASDVSQNSYEVSGLDWETTYLWQIVARDNHGETAASQVWSFRTRPQNLPPPPASGLHPYMGSVYMGVYEHLRWTCIDPDGDALTYNVFFGTSNPPPLFESGVTTTDYWPGLMTTETTYYWSIEARDPGGLTSRTSTFTFTTTADRPVVFSSPSPPDHAINVGHVGQLKWRAVDPDGSTLRYDVYFGATNPPPLIRTGLTTPYSYHTGTEFGVQYYWKVVARDESGVETEGPVWTFTTGSQPTISNPIPADGATVPAVTYVPPPDSTLGEPTLRFEWDAVSANGLPVTCTVQFATEIGSLIQISDLISADPGTTHFTYDARVTIEEGTVYYWRVIAGDDAAYLWGPVWSFTGGEGDGGVLAAASRTLQLGASHPNPFNPTTTIPYVVPAGSPARVRLVIYDVGGRIVRTLVDEEQAGGERRAIWNGTNADGRVVGSGIYFCVLQAGNERRTQKLLLLK